MTTSRVEDILNAYFDGSETWPKTRAALIDFPYVAPTWNQGSNLVAVEGHDAVTERDTFDEVSDAYHGGKLSADEYYSILSSRQRRAKAAARQSRAR